MSTICDEFAQSYQVVTLPAGNWYTVVTLPDGTEVVVRSDGQVEKYDPESYTSRPMHAVEF